MQLVLFDHFASLQVTSDRTRLSNWYSGLWWNPIDEAAHIQQDGSVVRITHRPGQPVGETDLCSLYAYGGPFYIEVRACFDPTFGAWPAIWLLPIEGQQIQAKAQAGDATVAAGEIDIMEWQAYSPRTYYASVHQWMGSELNEDKAPVQPNAVQFPADADPRQWHTYGVLFTPGAAGADGKLEFYFDGVAVLTSVLPAAVAGQHYYIVLSMLYGDNWENNIPLPAQTLATLLVDYVQVWQ